MERMVHLMFSAGAGLVMAGFWGGLVAWFHAGAGMVVGIGLFVITVALVGKLRGEWWADGADLEVASQEGKAV